ncbi:MAG: FliH/SctL family protein [Gemmatimonadales bacterium]
MSSSEPPTAPPWLQPGPAAERGPWGPPDLRGADSAADAPEIDPVEAVREAAFAEGFEAGRNQARAELQPAHDALARIVGEVEREILSVRRRAENNLHALGLAVARWLLLREVDADPLTVEPLIRRAIALLPAGTPVEIHAHPAEVELLTNALALTEPDGRTVPVHWVADTELERGSFTITSPERIIDGRTDVALRTLYERLVSD